MAVVGSPSPPKLIDNAAESVFWHGRLRPHRHGQRDSHYCGRRDPHLHDLNVGSVIASFCLGFLLHHIRCMFSTIIILLCKIHSSHYQIVGYNGIAKRSLQR